MQHEPIAEQAPDASSPTAVQWLIGVCVAVYVAQLSVFSAGDVRAALGFEMRDLDGAFWTVGTHAFVHASFWHLVSNVGALWLFGPRLEAAWGRAQFAAFYACAALGGWAAHALFVRHGLMFGASAGVIGVMVAYATRWPGDRIPLGGAAAVGVRATVAVLIVLNLLIGSGIDAPNGAAYLAHAGGLVTAWAYLRLAGSLHIDRLRQRVAPVPDEPDEMPPRAFPRSLPRQRNGREAREVDDIVAQSHAAVAEATARAQHPEVPPTAAPLTSQSELNSLLDKISAEGLEALTQTERLQLEEAARRLRDR